MPATATGSGSLAVTSDHTVPVAGMARSYNQHTRRTWRGAD